MRRGAGGGRARGLRALALAVSLALWLVPAGPAGAASELVGQVVNDTTGEAVPGLEVVLRTFRGQSEVGTRTSVTDDDGGFRFSDLDDDPSSTHQVTTRYGDVDYQSDVIPPTSEEQQRVLVKVYEPTTSADELAITSWVVWIDREGDGVAVQQDIEVENAGNETFVGTEPVGEGDRAVLQLDLAPGATDFQYLGIFMQCCAVVRGTTFIHTMPIQPGRSRATLRYTATSPTSLTFPVPLPTTSFSLLVPADLRVSSGSLAAAGQTEDQGTTYQAYTAGDLQPGTELSVSLEGLSEGGSTLGLALLVLGILAGATALVLGGRALSRRGARKSGQRPERGRRPPTRKARPESSRGAPSTAHSAGRSEGAVPDDEDVELLVEEIAALDLARERGLLEETVHRRLREAAKARLLRIKGGSEVSSR